MHSVTNTPANGTGGIVYPDHRRARACYLAQPRPWRAGPPGDRSAQAGQRPHALKAPSPARASGCHSLQTFGALMIPLFAFFQPMRALRPRRCGWPRAFCLSCRERHRTRLARAVLSSGARAGRGRPARRLRGVSLPCLLINRSTARHGAQGKQIRGAIVSSRLWANARERYVDEFRSELQRKETLSCTTASA